MPNFLNEGHRQIAKPEIWIPLWVSTWLTCRVHSVAQLRPSVPQPPSVASRPLALPLPWLPTSRPELEGLEVWSGHSLVTSVTPGEFCVPSPTVFSAWVQHGPSSWDGGKVEWEHIAAHHFRLIPLSSPHGSLPSLWLPSGLFPHSCSTHFLFKSD